MVALAAFEQVGKDHGVGEGAGHFQARAAQGEHVVLDILSNLFNGRIGEDRSEGIQGLLLVEPRRRQRRRGLAGSKLLRPAMKTKARPTGIAKGSIAVVSESMQNFGCGLQVGQECLERLGRVDRLVVCIPGLLRGWSSGRGSGPSSSLNRWKPHSSHSARKTATFGTLGLDGFPFEGDRKVFLQI